MTIRPDLIDRDILGPAKMRIDAFHVLGRKGNLHQTPLRAV